MDFSNRLVIVVNASVDVLKLIREVLEQSRIKTVLFFGPELQAEAKGFLSFVHEHKPDLILFDVPLPFEENLRLLAKLRDSIEHAQKFLVMTTSPDTVQAAIQREPALGERVIDIVVGKPFNLDELLAAVQKGLEAKAVAARTDGA